MRRLDLYLRTRRVGHVIAGLIFTAALGVLAADWLMSIPQLGGTGGQALIPVILLVPLISACLIGLGLDSPSSELERSVSYPMPILRSLHLLILGALALIAVAALSLAWNHSDSELMLTRNLAGFIGLTLITAWMFGGRLSWTVPLAFGMLSVLNGRDSAGTMANWAWTVLPGQDALALATAITLLAVGAALVIQYGPRPVTS